MKVKEENSKGASYGSSEQGGMTNSVVNNMGVICQNYYAAGTSQHVGGSGSSSPGPGTSDQQDDTTEKKEEEEDSGGVPVCGVSVCVPVPPVQEQLSAGSLRHYFADGESFERVSVRLRTAHNAQDICRSLFMVDGASIHGRLPELLRQDSFLQCIRPYLESYTFSHDIRNLRDCIRRQLERSRREEGRMIGSDCLQDEREAQIG